MTTLQHEVSIKADADTVWRTLSDLLAVKHYNPLVASVRHVCDKTAGIGASRRCELKPNGWAEERVWEFNPPHAIGLEVTASTWPLVYMKWKTELHPSGGETLVSQEMHYKLKFGLLGMLLDKLVMRRKLDASISEVFGNLKSYIENSHQ